jgi:hypothetical protein
VNENSSYLKFGSKSINSLPEKSRDLPNVSNSAEEGLVKVKEINGIRSNEHSSSVPRLPSIPKKRPTANGLRKLQDHLAKAQGETSDLEFLDEEEN